jgi:putative ABC transport system substrate-binding protein
VTRRRNVIAGLGVSAVAAALPRSLVAQERPNFLRVGATSSQPRASAFTSPGFEQRMAELGYVEGKNFAFDYIDLKGDTSRYGEAMRELVQSNVDIIVAFGPEVALTAALDASKTIPIVMVAIDYDPLAKGYVTGLARPTGSVTGIFLQQIELAAKRLQLLQDAFPQQRAITVFWDAISSDQWEATRGAAPKSGISVVGVELKDYPYDYERALAQAPPEYRGFLLMTTSTLFARDRSRLIAFVTQHKIGSMFAFTNYVELGGLMSYGPNREAMSRRAADYVNRIARGAKPSDLPIEQPTTFELVINLKTAKVLGLDLSPAILLRADKVIE